MLINEYKTGYQFRKKFKRYDNIYKSPFVVRRSVVNDGICSPFEHSVSGIDDVASVGSDVNRTRKTAS